MARDKGVDATRKYDLGALAVKYGAMGKLSDVSKALAKKYGGWGEIPVDLDDPDAERAADAASFREYLEHDVGGSRGLYAALLEELGGTMPDYLVREHRVAAIAAQISHNGFLVDQPLLAQRVEEIQRRKAESMALLAGKYGIPTADAKGKEYASPLASKLGKEALEAALLAAGVRPKALWRTPNSGDLQISADAMLHYGREYGGNKTVLEIVKAVYRIVSARSIYETAQNAMGPDGRVHPKISFKQATGRWSSTEPGLTVFGKRGGRHVERAVLLPDPGQLLVAFDLSQVDMRAVAGLSQDLAYIEMLKTDDPHTELALALFGDPGMRETAKPIGHGWNYGESLKRISMSNNIEPHLVVQFDRMMRERFSRLVEWQDEVRALASSGQLLDNGFGRLMRPDPQRAHTQGPALMGQGAARDIMMAGCLNLPAEVLPMLRAQVHDEIVLSIPADLVEDVSRVVVDALSLHGEPWRGVPILADRSPAGTDWSKCYEK
jgi:DNA polymerase-1